MAQLEALEVRRAIAIRHARFDAALIAAATINTTPRGEDAEPVSPFDFLPGFERDELEVQREKDHKAIIHGVRIAATQLKAGQSWEELKAKMIRNMTEAGVEDPEGIIAEAWDED